MSESGQLKKEFGQRDVQRMRNIITGKTGDRTAIQSGYEKSKQEYKEGDIWEEWVGHEVTKDDIRALTVADVAPLYKKKYWDKCRCDDLPHGVDFAVFDLAINSGTGRASKFLQTACGVAADGAIGPATLAAVAKMNPRELATKICERRLEFLQALPTWGTFGKGWGRRVAETEEIAFKMVG